MPAVFPRSVRARLAGLSVLVVVALCAVVFSGASLHARSRSQAEAVDALAQGVGELDAWTQDNASWVHRSFEAATALQQQADHLQRAVGRFRLPAAGPV